MKAKGQEWPCNVGDRFTIDGKEVEIKLVCRPTKRHWLGWFGVLFDDPDNWGEPDKWKYMKWEKFIEVAK